MYLFIAFALLALIGMMTGYVEKSIIRALLFIIGIALFSIAVIKEKKKPKYDLPLMSDSRYI